jgi:hypothetical protein
MNGYRYGILSLVIVGLAGLSGAGCPQRLSPDPAPRVLPAAPGLEQVISAVNRNALQIQSFSTTSASLSVPGNPTLHASIAYQRPRGFRLRAETGLTGAEVDLGSNDQIFWYWIRRQQPPAVYFCRHDQFATCPARAMIPIEPTWLVEALGTAEIDPALPHQGPFPVGGNRLEIRTIRETPEGPTTRVTILDAVSAWIMEQHVYDARGQLRASAVAEGYRRDPLSGLYMPSAVRVSCPPAGFSMRIELGNVEVNRPLGDPGELWTIPTFPGTPMVDLCDPRLRPAPAAALPPGVYPQGDRRGPNLLSR